MRNNSRDETIKRNYTLKYRFLICEYQRVKAGQAVMTVCTSNRHIRKFAKILINRRKARLPDYLRINATIRAIMPQVNKNPLVPR